MTMRFGSLFLFTCAIVWGWPIDRLTGDDLLSRQEIPTGWRSDAELRGVCFVDERTGWAVGDHGTILKTTDGGNTWSECNSVRLIGKSSKGMPADMKLVVNAVRDQTGNSGGISSETIPGALTAQLNDICFINPQIGWAVGGYEVPYVERSRAVILRTTNGGETWVPEPNVIIPAIHQVRFSGDKYGWALAQSGNLYRSGFLMSQDGGQSWSSQTTMSGGDWLRGSFDGQRFVGVDATGILRVMSDGQLEPAVVHQRPLRSIKDVIMVDERTGWAVGERGTLLETRDGGRSWTLPNAIQECAELRHYDLSTVAVVGQRVWFAGNPGSYIFCYEPATGLFSASQSPTQCGIKRMAFSGEQSGWACGQMGTILATVDGGGSWQIQRGGDPEVSMLMIDWGVAPPALEAIARYAGEDELKCLVARIAVNQLPNTHESRAEQAASRIGGLGQVSFCGFDKTTKTVDWPEIESQLVKWIRQYHPRAVVSNLSLVRLDDGQSIDVRAVLERVIESAASPDALNEQQAATSLGPWRVSRLMLGQNHGGHWSVADNVFLTKSGKLIGDQIAISRALHGAELSAANARGFEVIDCQSSGEIDDRGGFVESLQRAGIQLPRRKGLSVAKGNMRNVQLTMGKADLFQALLAQDIRTAGDEIVWQQSLAKWLISADEETAGVWLAQLAEGYITTGKLRMASLTFEQLLARVPQHPFAATAQIWSAHFNASREVSVVTNLEAAGTDRLDIPAQVKTAGYESSIQSIERDGVTQLVWVPKSNAADHASASSSTTLSSGELASDKTQMFWQTASKKLNRVKQRDPELGALPQIKWIEAFAISQLGGWASAESMFSQMMMNEALSPEFRQAATREIQLHQIDAVPNRSDWMSRLTTVRPRLDGRIDDVVWTEALNSGGNCCLKLTQPISGDSGANDMLLISHDEEFLYIALHCRKLQGFPYRGPTSPRRRDERLADQDRVRLSFDIDRDGYWPLRLFIDHRGCVADGCGDTYAWNPEWFVARSADETSWCIEAAIPWSQFGGGPPATGSNWSFGADRFATWSSKDLWSDPARPAGRIVAPLAAPRMAEDMSILRF